MRVDKGVTSSSEGYLSESWQVVGQTYTPKFVSDNAFIWHAEIPADTFVPPHIHPKQDEWINVITGALEIEFGGELHHAVAGDTVRMPMGLSHGIFNRSGSNASCVFGVAPSGKLFDLFRALDGVTDPEELVRLSTMHEVDFLPPPEDA